jgi:hypothetical protein
LHLQPNSAVSPWDVPGSDPSTHHLVAVWDTGIGATAHPVARLNPATNETVGLHLARALTRMSKAVWLSYVRPEICDLPVADALQAMRRPHLPEAGLLRVEPHPVVESAHRGGRELREVGSAGVSRAVIADVEEEITAAGNAERGDLAGRARQAVMLAGSRRHRRRSRSPTGCCTTCRWAARASTRRSSRRPPPWPRSTGSWPRSP